MSKRRNPSRGVRLAGLLLGFALGGFFDGILLHQILQWHHLLSLVDGVGDLRAQVAADGIFHAVMYLLAAIGLALLWRHRPALAIEGGQLPGRLLIGFGAWHAIDAVLSHWLLGIHRIRLDSASPLAWDIGWLLVFGLVPIAIGLRWGGGGRPPPLRGPGPALALVLAVLGAGIWAAQPPADARTALVVFRPGIDDGDALTAILATGGQPVAHSRGIWTVGWPAEAQALPLYGRGALFVGQGPIGVGCLAWARA